MPISDSLTELAWHVEYEASATALERCCKGSDAATVPADCRFRKITGRPTR